MPREETFTMTVKAGSRLETMDVQHLMVHLMEMDMSSQDLFATVLARERFMQDCLDIIREESLI